MHSRLYTRVLNQYHWVHSCTAYNSTFNNYGLVGIQVWRQAVIGEFTEHSSLWLSAMPASHLRPSWRVQISRRLRCASFLTDVLTWLTALLLLQFAFTCISFTAPVPASLSTWHEDQMFLLAFL
jgi:hypothetical protein